MTARAIEVQMLHSEITELYMGSQNLKARHVRLR